MAKEVHNVEGAVAPVGAYSAAVEANGLVFISGQVAIDPATDAPVMGDVSVQARRVMENIKILLAGVGLGFGDIAKTTIFLANIRDFSTVNEVYGSYFDADPPARSTLQAGALPGGYLVEIEVIAAR